ncbi:Ribulose-5-phosphate 4-epimerase/Fuculose-1-phosphate aldolase [Micromonospora pallida]|uniref:3-oxo-tetronate 4-phosphate decarboxylase n=1 Tax=Micromonospora pallida TaxID=145854 RepID=A0A1C6RNF5_9ACTN|nr:3-oxo-tetronate 4-phosphate decarboxylase [Micromonospora pallida]SCL18706.1 Ribulose-5-phosphate 4-epimerase/Fuculose-1-phosphate aldolase [Micromonospora pallida]
MTEAELRDEVIATARSLFTRSLTHGRTGNISVRLDDRILVTPTGSSLGTVRADHLSVIDTGVHHLAGPRPSKEAFLHAAVYRARPGATAVIHTHSTHSAAVSCLAGVDQRNVLPPLTAYFAMRIGRLPMLPYHAPGDESLGALAESTARDNVAFLLSNHGPVVAGESLPAALDALEELEETAKLFLLLQGHRTRPLTDRQVRDLAPR